MSGEAPPGARRLVDVVWTPSLSELAWTEEEFSGNKTYARGCEGAEEFVPYPNRPGLTNEEWVAEAHVHARRVWSVIGPVIVTLAEIPGHARHALRMEPRGYGRKRRNWNITTECGQEISGRMGWTAGRAYLRDTTCLSCRKVIREGFERDLFFKAREEGMRAAGIIS